MAELTQQERLQPSLLDRLTDEEPGRHSEPKEKRVISMRRLRRMVLRDLGWLLNTTNLSTTEELGAYPEVAHSVLNFGIDELSGHLLSGIESTGLERMIRQAVKNFEPRILPNTVKVRVIKNEARQSPSSLTFEIEGRLWSVPVPTHLLVRTEVDLEEGNVILTDYFGIGQG